MDNYDELSRREFKKNKNSVVGYLLVASYIYYYRPHMAPILSDSVYDKMAKWLYSNFDEVEHKYKHLINRDDLKAGSLFAIGDYDYPLGIVDMALLMSERCEDGYEWLELND